MNILLVDDEVLAIQYIAGLVDWQANGYQVCAIAHSVSEAKQLLQTMDINIVIFDVFMPEENGVQLSSYIAAHYPQIGMLALSSYDTYDYVREILKNGAHDYILKHRVTGEQLLSSLKSMEANLIFTPSSSATKPIADFDLQLTSQPNGLSHQLALTLEQQKCILHSIEQKDGGSFTEALDAVFSHASMQFTASRLMITKEILDFLASFAAKYSLAFSPETKLSALIGVIEQGDGHVLAKNLSESYRELLENLQQASGSHYVQLAASYVQHFYYRNISLEKCAKSIGVNASYLSRIFHQESKVTFSKYLSQVRIQMAKTKILQGCPLKQVASECGFKNYNYFFKVFKDVEGVTPLGYMEQELGKKN